MRAIGRFSRSSSFTVGALFTAMMLLAVYFVAYFMVLASDETLIRESEAAIHADISGLKESEFMSGIGAVKAKLMLRVRDPENTFFYALRDESQTVVIANIPEWPSGPVERVKEGTFTFEVSHKIIVDREQSIRPMSEHYDVMAKVHRFDSGHELLVGRDVDDLEIAQYVANTFGWLMIAILIAIAVTSMLVGYYVVSRINRIADTTDNIISTGNLSTRLPVDSNWDDLSKLSIALNRMLDELEDLVRGVKSVSDNIAHDLRTPLTRLRSDIENVNDAQTRYSLIAEVDNILSIFNGLLRIADIETEKQKRAFSTHDIGKIVDDVVELYRPLAEHKHVKLCFATLPCELHCDRDLMFQACANVVDNAIKFTPQGGEIRVGMQCSQNQVSITISDSGIGLAEEYFERVLTRFFRVEKSRTTVGNGLGLALVAAVVKLHNGNIAFSQSYPDRTEKGLTCTLTFKL